eukprot:9431740-Pyramimonas_sp.AAC.1
MRTSNIKSPVHCPWVPSTQASKLDVTDIGAARVLFKCGFDFEKRPVVVMVRSLPFPDVPVMVIRRSILCIPVPRLSTQVTRGSCDSPKHLHRIANCAAY